MENDTTEVFVRMDNVSVAKDTGTESVRNRTVVPVCGTDPRDSDPLWV